LGFQKTKIFNFDTEILAKIRIRDLPNECYLLLVSMWIMRMDLLKVYNLG